MQLGVFAKTFQRPTLEENLDAVRTHGLQVVQYNLSCAGLTTLPDRIGPDLCDRVRQALASRGMTMAAISGTFNIIHPDRQQRELGLTRLRTLAAACPALDTGIITLCTGTRDPVDMWRRHRDNDSPAAWHDLVHAMARALTIAEEFGLTLAVEPELSNVVDSAAKARRLLDELRTPHLGIIIDPANLFPAGQLPRMREVIGEACELLAADIVLAHAKDLHGDGAAGDAAAGTGLLDYDCYLGGLRQIAYAGPLILHGLTEAEVPGSVAFLRAKVAA